VIDIETAARLLNFNAHLRQEHRAQEQLEGAVAVHNILQKHRIAYLADEVGMGKTYVALGAVALFRHYHPDFRLVVIAPQENIQRKWIKELTNFAAYNVRFPDLRFTAFDREPVRSPVLCENLIDFVHEVVVDSGRDFFLRLSSFSLPLGSDPEGWKRLRDRLRRLLPWLAEEAFDLRNKDAFKDNFARAVCCALPTFDLVIVDEGHKLKRGFSMSAAARNRVLALTFGRHSGHESRRLFPRYSPRAERVLFLSATPLEEAYQQIWNQLDVFGLGAAFEGLRGDDLTDEQKRAEVAQFLVRRVTTIQVAGRELTKNQYRREWRRGGVHLFDEPIQAQDDRQRLVVALVQKKVAELLGSDRFNRSFQIGMLASFESFLETAKLKPSNDDESNFDDPGQTDERDEREGIDVRDVNRLARDYRKTFGHEMPHPKMDEVVESLAHAWIDGKKSLIFVRRVASVWELKRKLDELYDRWLIGELQRRLPEGVRIRFDAVVRRYLGEKQDAERARQARLSPEQAPEEDELERGILKDRGGTDTFFEWFFRGDGPRGIVSGANVQRRFIQRSAAYATFFEDNHVMALLRARPGEVVEELARTLGESASFIREKIKDRAARYLSAGSKRHARADRMEAAQAAALELLRERSDTLGESSRMIWHERYESTAKLAHAREAPDLSVWLEQPTLFTELRRPERAELRERLWPEPQHGTERDRFLEQELRGQLLATAARLGHAFIDLYVQSIRRLGSLDLRSMESASEEDAPLDQRRIDEYLDLLDEQRRTEIGQRPWGAFDELSEIASNFELILDVNAADVRTRPLSEAARYFGSLLRQQQPVGGMSGQLNRTLVQQFRMPGYPLVLITTELLQEGEDLHTFCSSVLHYGISWTPSSMEQRIGRIDRVRSQTERRLSHLAEMPSGTDLLQVYFPYLNDTVEVLQVRRVLERMNIFLRLMHEGLMTPKEDVGRIDVEREIAVVGHVPEAIHGRLRSAFPVPEWAKRGRRTALAPEETVARAALQRFHGLRIGPVPGLTVIWESIAGNGQVFGNVEIAPGKTCRFEMLLKSDAENLVLRCVSQIGQVNPDRVKTVPVRIGASLSQEEQLPDLTIEEDVPLVETEHDAERLAMLLRRVAEHADFVEHQMEARERGVSASGAPQTPWRQLCRDADGVTIEDDTIVVALAGERLHRIEIRDVGDAYELTSNVARAAVLNTIPEVELRVWRRNRSAQLVGFLVDRRGRLIGEAWLPKVGLRRSEFLLRVRRLAAECDVFEYLLSGN
jgi:hypothetical protein